MPFMIILNHDDPDPAALAAYFAALGDAGAVLSAERVTPGAGAAISITGDAITVSNDVSGLRALWIVDTRSKQAAVDIARGIPGARGHADVWEVFRGDGDEPTAPPPPMPAPAGMQRYITLVRADAQSESGAGPSPAVMAEMGGYITHLNRTNPMLGGAGLRPSSRAVRLRRSADARNVIDGPFAESKEMVAGYGIIPARSLDEAIDLVRPWLVIHARHTNATTSTFEVWQLL